MRVPPGLEQEERTVTEQGLMSSLVLGTGGRQPGVWLLSLGEDHASSVLELPAGHSAYAIDLDADSGLVAVGTRAGTIHVFSWPQRATSQAQEVLSLHQGAPVLSVCLLGPDRLVTADTAGRCLVWNLNGDLSNPQACDTGGELICSLLALPDDRLVGLSAGGRLVFWDQVLVRPERFVTGPRPPKKLSLVRLQYWPKHEAIVYPGAHGRLVLCQPDRPEIHVRDAHDGEFFAIVVDDEGLYTIGRNDGLAKVWENTDGAPSRQLKAPSGVIAAAAFGDAAGKAILIHDSFEAAVYTLRSDPLKPIGWLGIRSYRSVAGVSARVRHTARKDQEQAIIEDLQARIQEKFQSNDFEGIEALHEQLLALGFESVSLALRAQQAALQQDLVGEMRIRRRLAQILVPPDPQSWLVLLRYAELLEAAWQLTEAKEIRERIPPEQMREPSVQEWLNQATGIMEGDDWVGASTFVPTLIDAANEFQRPFTGRWAVGNLGHHALACHCKVVTAEVLAAKYEQIREERGLSDLSPAQAGRYWWLAPRVAAPTETVVFEEPSNRAGPALQIAAQIQEHGTECVVILRGLLDAGRPGPGQSWEDHNRQVLAVFRQTEQAGPLNVWSRPVREIVMLALRRLRNLARSQQTEREGL